MAGETILVTGSTDGIGRATARELAERGCAVIVHGRDEQRAADAARQLATATGNPGVTPVAGDFGSLAEVRAMAERVLDACPRLDVLINNAGIAVRDRKLSADGYESTFAVNHLAPFLLTKLLLDRLRESAPARIVNVSSGAHSSGRIDLDDLQMARGFDGWAAYCNSKLANALFTCELARRVGAAEVTANFLHRASSTPSCCTSTSAAAVPWTPAPAPRCTSPWPRRSPTSREPTSSIGAAPEPPRRQATGVWRRSSGASARS